MTIRIWHQSLTDSQAPGYARMLEEHARRICGADTVVDLHGLRPSTYPGHGTVGPGPLGAPPCIRPDS
jgi:hypothetical protein